MSKLTPQQIEAARLRHDGKKWQEIADHFDMSISGVKLWGALDEFKSELARLKRVKADRTQAEIDAIAAHQQTLRESVRALHGTVLEVVTTAIKGIPDGAHFRQLPPLVRAYREIAELSLSTDKLAFPLDVDGFVKMALQNDVTPLQFIMKMDEYQKETVNDGN